MTKTLLALVVSGSLTGCIFGSGGDTALGDPETLANVDTGPFGILGHFADKEAGRPEPTTDCPVQETPFACEVIDLVNAERSAQGLRAVGYNWHLSEAAYLHAQDMSLNNYFSHGSLDGRRFVDRIEDVGYDAFPRSENIAYGYTTPADVMVGWMNSPGHRTNILDDTATELGVGYYAAGHYWVQNFGIR